MTFIIAEPFSRHEARFLIPYRDDEAYQRENLLHLALVQLLATSSHKIMLAKSPKARWRVAFSKPGLYVETHR
jgi:hypothetical protein